MLFQNSVLLSTVLYISYKRFLRKFYVARLYRLPISIIYDV